MAECMSTYRHSYQPINDGKVLPPIKFNQPPSFQLRDCGGHLAPRAFPLIPRGPHRRLYHERPLGPGLGTEDLHTERYLEAKPIVQTAPPRELVNNPPLLAKRRPSARKRNPPEKVIEAVTRLCDDVTYTSTTRHATEECKLPIKKVAPPQSTFEPNSDQVRLRPQKYAACPATWQKVAAQWDNVQTRQRQDRPREQIVRLNQSRLHRTGRRPVPQASRPVGELVARGNLRSPFVRQCPGYAGFTPRSPVEASLDADANSSQESIMKLSYKALPAGEYAVQPRAHKGPLSSTVTLTYPHNPFNKIESTVVTY